MPEAQADWRATQAAFSAYIRHPQLTELPPGASRERMAVYRELFLNTIDGLLSHGFPVLNQVLGETAWRALVSDFYARHRCQTPLFIELAEEFLQYLAEQRAPDANDPPFLAELAHYEWVELALATAQDPEEAPAMATADVALDHAFGLIETAWPLAYRFPVHRIGAQFIPTEAPAQATFLLVYRDTDDQVHFVENNAVTHRLLQELRDHALIRGDVLIAQLAAELGLADPAVLLGHGLETLRNLARRGILRTRPPT